MSGQSNQGGVRSVQPGGGSGQVSPASRGQVSPAGGGQVSPVGGGGGSGQSADGGVSILHPLAGGMPLAFTQEDFLVFSYVQMYNFSS